MPVSPIGNQLYVNQNMGVASQTQAQHQGKVDFQNVLNLQEFQNKEKEVEEVRPTEESDKIDPDREHEKQEAEQHQKENKEKEAHKDSTTAPSEHLLDIKI